MDHIRDYENFKRLVSRISVTFDKFANDELIESWWKALRTANYQDVERRVDDFIRRATDKTKFPRPGQFRAAEAEPDNWQSRESNRNWRELCARFPQTGPLRMRLAQASQILAVTREDSPAYAEAQREYFAIENSLGGRFGADR